MSDTNISQGSSMIKCRISDQLNKSFKKHTEQKRLEEIRDQRNHTRLQNENLDPEAPVTGHPANDEIVIEETFIRKLLRYYASPSQAV